MGVSWPRGERARMRAGGRAAGRARGEDGGRRQGERGARGRSVVPMIVPTFC